MKPSVKTSSIVLIVLIVFVNNIVGVDFSVMAVAMPSIGRSLNASPSLLQWIVSAYSLTLGGLVVVGGRLTDTYGHRWTCVVGCGLSLLSLIVAAFSPSILLLIAARFIQGAAAAILLPIPLSLIASEFPAGPERLRVLAIHSSAAIFIPIVGTILAGLLITRIGWRGSFLVILPFPIVGMTLGYYALRPLKPAEINPRSIDLSAAAVVTIGLTLFIWSLSGILHSASAGSSASFGVLAMSIGILCGLVYQQSRSKNPLVPPRMLHYPNFAAGLLVYALFSVCGAGAFVLVQMSLQRGAGYTPFESALMFLPKGVLVALLGFVVVPRIGSILLSRPRFYFIVSVLVVSGAEVIMSLASPAHGVILTFLPSMLTVSAGVVVALPIITGEVFRHIPEGETGIAAALFQASSFIFMAVGLSVIIGSITANDGSAPVALAAFATAYRVAAGFGLISIVAVIFLLRSNVAQSASAQARVYDP